MIIVMMIVKYLVLMTDIWIITIVEYLVLMTDIWICEMFNDNCSDDSKVFGSYN